MELAARKVLNDCRLAHSMMERASDPNELRVLWIGGLGILRLVGDVLDKVDSRSHPHLAREIASHWSVLKSSREPIFWDFIKGARDRALHEYEVDLYGSSSVEVVVRTADGTERLEQLDDCLFMPLVDGYGAGEDARDIYLEAITWWDRQLASFEVEAP